MAGFEVPGDIIPADKGNDYGEWVLYSAEFREKTHYLFWKNCVMFEVESLCRDTGVLKRTGVGDGENDFKRDGQ